MAAAKRKGSRGGLLERIELWRELMTRNAWPACPRVVGCPLNEQDPRGRHLPPLGDGLLSDRRLAVGLELLVDKRRDRSDTAGDIDCLLQSRVPLDSIHDCAKV